MKRSIIISIAGLVSVVAATAGDITITAPVTFTGNTGKLDISTAVNKSWGVFTSGTCNPIGPMCSPANNTTNVYDGVIPTTIATGPNVIYSQGANTSVPYNIANVSGVDSFNFNVLDGAGAGTGSLFLNTSASNVDKIYLLLNSINLGAASGVCTGPGGTCADKVTISGTRAGGSTTPFTVFLTQNVDYSDYKGGPLVSGQGAVSGGGSVTAKEVFVSNTGVYNLDQQTITLPVTFTSITQIQIQDLGASTAFRTVLTGVSFNTTSTPEPSTMILFGAGIGLLFAAKRRFV